MNASSILEALTAAEAVASHLRQQFHELMKQCLEAEELSVTTALEKAEARASSRWVVDKAEPK